MKIGTRLVLSFLVIALSIFVLVAINWTIIENVHRQSSTEEFANKISKNIYLEETVADAYIRRAVSENFEIEENSTDVEAIAQDFFRIHNNNSVLIGKLQEMISTDEEKQVLSVISHKHDELGALFESNHQYYTLKLNKLTRQNEIGIKIADLRHDLKVIITDPVYFNHFSKNIAFYSPISKKIENKTVPVSYTHLTLPTIYSV